MEGLPTVTATQITTGDIEVGVSPYSEVGGVEKSPTDRNNNTTRVRYKNHSPSEILSSEDNLVIKKRDKKIKQYKNKNKKLHNSIDVGSECSCQINCWPNIHTC